MSFPSDTILLVEDNDDDVFALRRAFRKAGVTQPLQVVGDGQKAIDYLSGAGPFADRERHPLPFLVFLDLKLPYRDGFEVLAWIRRQPGLGGIAVVILTGSDEVKDHERTYALGAHGYLVKPPAPTEIRRAIDSVARSGELIGGSAP